MLQTGVALPCRLALCARLAQSYSFSSFLQKQPFIFLFFRFKLFFNQILRNMHSFFVFPVQLFFDQYFGLAFARPFGPYPTHLPVSHHTIVFHR